MSILNGTGEGGEGDKERNTHSEELQQTQSKCGLVKGHMYWYPEYGRA